MFLNDGNSVSDLLQLPMDITSHSDMESVLDSVRSQWGEPNILVNNAAIDAPPGAGEQETGPFEDYPESSWDQMMDVNLKGMFLSSASGSQMRKGSRSSTLMPVTSQHLSILTLLRT